MQMPEMLDNVSKTVKDDLTLSINKGGMWTRPKISNSLGCGDMNVRVI